MPFLTSLLVVSLFDLTVEVRLASTIGVYSQPFYPDLDRLAALVSTNRATVLLNFYAVMAEAGRRAEALGPDP